MEKCPCPCCNNDFSQVEGFRLDKKSFYVCVNCLNILRVNTDDSSKLSVLPAEEFERIRVEDPLIYNGIMTAIELSKPYSYERAKAN